MNSGNIEKYKTTISYVRGFGEENTMGMFNHFRRSDVYVKKIDISYDLIIPDVNYYDHYGDVKYEIMRVEIWDPIQGQDEILYAHIVHEAGEWKIMRYLYEHEMVPVDTLFEIEEAFIDLIEWDVNGYSKVFWRDSNGSKFSIELDWGWLDYYNQVFLVDLTGDGEKELVIGINYPNTAISDVNLLIVYDLANGREIFPTAEKFGLIGYISQIENGGEIKNVIKHEDYSKYNMRVFTEELSIIAWNGEDFVPLEYRYKLLEEDTWMGYFIFYRKVLIPGGVPKHRIEVDFFTEEDYEFITIYEMEFEMDEAEVLERIEAGTLLDDISFTWKPS
jgi:hypothetical protein